MARAACVPSFVEPGGGNTTAERRLFGEFDPLWVSRFERTATLLTVASVLAAILALVGRQTEVWRLATWVGGPAVRPMQVLTALAFIGFGIAVMLGLRGTPRPWAVWVARTLILASGAAGVLVVLARHSGRFTVPQWLRGSVQFADIAGGEFAGIPATNEGIVLVILAVAVLLLSFRRQVASVIGQAMAVIVATIGGVVAVAFFYGDPSLAGFPFGTGRMAFSAAATASMMAVAVLLSHPESGFVAPLTSPWSGGILLRRLLPLVLVVPPAAVALMLTGLGGEQERPRLLAWLAVVASVLLGIGLLTTASSVNRAGRSIEAAHDLSDRALSTVKHNAELADELRGLLVRNLDEHSGALEFAVRYRPAEGLLAGDAAVIQPLDGSRVGLAVVDVAGHGRVPAVTALRVSDLVLHSMLGGMAPSRAIESVMWVVASNKDMATAVVAEVDSVSGALRYVVAGHPPVLIHRSDGTVEQLEPTGPLLFAGLDGGWNERLAVMQPGDTLVVYTDGVADPQESEHAGAATVANLTEAVRRFHTGDVDELAELCLNEASGRARGRLRDDATVAVIRRTK